eukprot:scaffold421388_cov49-Attheya_sp.AAC.1
MMMKFHVPNLLVLGAIASIIAIVSCGGVEAKSHCLVSAFAGRPSFGRQQSASKTCRHRLLSIRSMTSGSNRNSREAEEPVVSFNRRSALCQGVAAVLVILDRPARAVAVQVETNSYSSNARNMNRLAGGDGSG